MVSFQTVPLSPTRRKTILECDNLSKKRKWEDNHRVAEVKPLKTKTNKSIFNTELHLETSLPSEWQRCLDIKSGQIYFYNTRTHKRTSKDPRLTSPEPQSPGHDGHMSLDLELNLPCGSVIKNNNHHITHNFMKNNNSGEYSSNHMITSDHHDEYFMNSIRCRNKKINSEGLTRVPSWLAFGGDHDQREMVTAVCKKCHMLVMMCKSAPSCPNCKFMHPLNQSPPNLFKQRLGLLCDI